MIIVKLYGVKLMDEICVGKIETPRLILRRYTMEDLQDYVEYRSDQRLHTFLPTKVREDKSGYKGTLQNIINNYDKKEGPSRTWAIELRKKSKIVGSISIEDYSQQHKCLEIGWAVSPQYWGKGDCHRGRNCTNKFFIYKLRYSQNRGFYLARKFSKHATC